MADDAYFAAIPPSRLTEQRVLGQTAQTAHEVRTCQGLPEFVKMPKEVKTVCGMWAYRYLVTTFVDAVRQTLKAGGLAQKANEQEVIRSELLVGQLRWGLPL